jgi:co-chaperonin GroES (HSP10)
MLDRVVIRKLKPVEKTASGIFIPEKSQDTIQQGEVLSVGPGDKVIWQSTLFMKLTDLVL